MKLNYFAYKLALLLILPLCLQSQSITAGEVVFESVEIEIAGEVFDIEVANTPGKRQQGLMYRENLAAQSGMLFLFPEADDHRIWMKNTFIPLTVIWLDAHARVIDIKKLKPCRQYNCPVYGVNKPSKFIIELNSQFNGLKPGDRIPALLNL